MSAQVNGTNGTNGVETTKIAESIKAAGPAVDISVALTANNLESVPGLVNAISALGDKAASGDEDARLELVEQARSLVHALEKPRETMIKHCWAQPSASTALTFGIDVGLFHLLAKDNGSAKNANDLAKQLAIEPPLLCRLMRHLASMEYITETGIDEYKPTNFSNSLTIPIIGDGYPCVNGCLAASLYRFHEFARQHNYKVPNSISDGALQFAYNTKLNMFEHLQANPPYGMQFNHHMGGYRQGRPAWMDAGFYPVKERLLDGFEASNESPLLVDIGGSIGHDLDDFRQKFPDAPGRLVLQDLPLVISQIRQLDEKIERLPYDFYEEQPLKGARAYYMHSVLHDWPDDTCVKILQRVKEAMKPGYSRLLINENVIPLQKAQWEATALDILMLTLLSSRERTETEWRDLIEKTVGLKIIKIYAARNGVESVIECEVAA